MRENLKFNNLSVDSTALLCPNPIEFYSKAYITPSVNENFRVLPNIKYKTKIATTSFTSLLQASSCDFSSVGSNPLSAIEIDVEGVSAMAEICQFDLEQSWLSAQMVAGSNGSFEVASFMSFYWGEMAKEINSEIEGIRWKGNTATASYTGATAYLKLADGYEKKLTASSDVTKITATATTTSNVIAQFTQVYQALMANAPALTNRQNDLRFYVSPNVAAAFRLAVSQGNTLAYVTKNLDLTYLDIKIIACEGMSSNRILLTLKDNLIYAFDSASDATDLKAVNLTESVAEPKLRTRTNLKLGFHLVNEAEMVWFA